MFGRGLLYHQPRRLPKPDLEKINPVLDLPIRKVDNPALSKLLTLFRLSMKNLPFELIEIGGKTEMCSPSCKVVKSMTKIDLEATDLHAETKGKAGQASQ
jgi:hypothetical protein